MFFMHMRFYATLLLIQRELNKSLRCHILQGDLGSPGTWDGVPSASPSVDVPTSVSPTSLLTKGGPKKKMKWRGVV